MLSRAVYCTAREGVVSFRLLASNALRPRWLLYLADCSVDSSSNCRSMDTNNRGTNRRQKTTTGRYTPVLTTSSWAHKRRRLHSLQACVYRTRLRPHQCLKLDKKCVEAEQPISRLAKESDEVDVVRVSHDVAVLLLRPGPPLLLGRVGVDVVVHDVHPGLALPRLRPRVSRFTYQTHRHPQAKRPSNANVTKYSSAEARILASEHLLSIHPFSISKRSGADRQRSKLQAEQDEWLLVVPPTSLFAWGKGRAYRIRNKVKTPPWVDFSKLKYSAASKSVGPEQGRVGKISSRAVHQRIVWR